LFYSPEPIVDATGKATTQKKLVQKAIASTRCVSFFKTIPPKTMWTIVYTGKVVGKKSGNTSKAFDFFQMVKPQNQ
jgi:hypothetical protein